MAAAPVPTRSRCRPCRRRRRATIRGAIASSRAVRPRAAAPWPALAHGDARRRQPPVRAAARAPWPAVAGARWRAWRAFAAAIRARVRRSLRRARRADARAPRARRWLRRLAGADGDDGPRRLALLARRGRARSLDRHYRGTLPFDAGPEAVAREFARRHDALAARGIAYVVVVVPEKFTIYPEHLPAWVVRAPQTPLDRVAAAVRADGRVRFVDLRAPLVAAKGAEPVYYLTDSHWNVRGASVGYEALMREVQAALPGRIATVAPARCPLRAPRRFLQRRPGPHARPATAHPRATTRRLEGARRRASRCARRHRRRPSTRAKHGDATGRDCRMPGCCATRWRSRCSLLAENFSRVDVRVDARDRSAAIEREARHRHRGTGRTRARHACTFRSAAPPK